MGSRIQDLINEYMADKQEDEVAIFYKELIKGATHQEVEVRVDEISDGKYGVEIAFGEKILWLIAKAWDTSREIMMNLQGAIEELQLV